MDKEIGGFDLRMKPEVIKNEQGKPAFNTYNMGTAAVTAQTNIAGANTTTAYPSLPISWVKGVMQAAEENLEFTGAFKEQVLAPQQVSAYIRFETKKMASNDFQGSSGELAVNTNRDWTQIDNLEGVNFEPEDYPEGVEITYKAIRTSDVNALEHARKTLGYKAALHVNEAITTALDDAAAMSNTVRGMQTIFTADTANVTDADNSLNAGHTFSTEEIKKAQRLLKSKAGYFWDSHDWTESAVEKNPWKPTNGEPFICYIPPEFQEHLLGDPQFTNAAEWGGKDVVLNGIFARYLGINFVETTVVPSIAAAGTFTYNGGNYTTDVPIHTAFMLKSQRAGGLVWGEKPKISAWDHKAGAKMRVALDYAFKADTLYDDAIVKIACADNDA